MASAFGMSGCVFFLRSAVRPGLLAGFATPSVDVSDLNGEMGDIFASLVCVAQAWPSPLEGGLYIRYQHEHADSKRFQIEI